MAGTKVVNGKSKVARITIGRMFNLGNYENARYEVSLDLSPDDDPVKALNSLERILDSVRSKGILSEYDLESAQKSIKEIRAVPVKDRSEYQKRNLQGYIEKIRKHKAALNAREKARAALKLIGGNYEYTDHKLSWEDDGDW